MTNFRFHDEQTVNGLMKIAWASIFQLKWQRIYTLMENKTKRRTTTSACLLQTEIGNGKLMFVCCKQKQKTEVCYPWTANDTW
jgi:hypothetical protein